MSKNQNDTRTQQKAIILAAVSPTIDIHKDVNQAEAKVKDMLAFTVLITNTGPIDAQVAVLKDILPKELKFVPGSVFVDGVAVPSANVNSGVELGTLVTEQVIEVRFHAKVVNIPPNELLKNKATLTYKFERAAGSPLSTGKITSNETKTKITVRPPTNCELNQSAIEFSIKQEEKSIQELLDAEADKTRAANQAFQSGKITQAEQQLIVQSETAASQALFALTQALLNKRTTNQDLCSGCK